ACARRASWPSQSEGDGCDTSRAKVIAAPATHGPGAIVVKNLGFATRRRDPSAMSLPTRNAPKRPDPDALLALTRGETAGRLRVFLGAAPGVGKTFAMLNGARRLKADGVDIVVALVETHGRAETQAMLDGLEILPRRKVEYQGR